MIKTLIKRTAKKDINEIIRIENENFGPDSFNRRQFEYALKNTRAIFIKAESSDGDVCGYALGFFRMVKGRAPLGRLYSIAVAKRFHGMSIGRTLMDAFHERMAGFGCERIFLEVRCDNEPAIKMYERYGYLRSGVIEQYYHDGSPAYKYKKIL